MASLSVVVPTLFAHLFEQTDGFLDPGRWPALSVLCARAEPRPCGFDGTEQFLLQQFRGQRVQNEVTSVAALTARVDEPDLPHGHLMRADPVHLRADPNQILLFNDPHILPDEDEADALLQTLNDGFDDVQFSRGRHPARWYFQFPGAVTTFPAQAAKGRSVAKYMPRGDDGNRLRQLMNDAQMLLYDAPVNRAREARGAPPVNAIWPWRGDAVLEQIAEMPDLVAGDDVLTAALAMEYGIEWRPASAPQEILGLISNTGCRALAVIGSPTGAVAGRAQEVTIDEIEQTWASRLLYALRRFELRRLELVTDREVYTITPWHLLRVWRKPLRLPQAV